MTATPPAEPQPTPYEAGRRFGKELLREHPLPADLADRLAAVLVRPRTDQTRRAS